MAKALARCPVCDGMLGISELSCERCKTTIHGAFEPCRFCRLSPEHLGFIELFLRCEGNLSRVEKELNLSYPTVRNRLSAAVNALGFSTEATLEPVTATDAQVPAGERRKALLDGLARGEISADEAAEALRTLG